MISVLYNMAGNVSEWTGDLYRPMTSMSLRDVEGHDLNPFRGNIFQQRVIDENGRPVEKDSLGRIRYAIVEDSVAAFVKITRKEMFLTTRMMMKR